MEDIQTAFESMGLQHNYDLITYIRSIKTVDEDMKQHLIHLIENDNYNSYMEIYNICIENDIELPAI
jgi:hypothetical protein